MERPYFTLNGHTDREEIMRECHREGWSEIAETYMEGLVAYVCRQLLARLGSSDRFEDQAALLLSGVAGIVECAEKDGLL